MTPDELHVVVPGALDQRTGGYLYDARMVDGLRRMGWQVEVHGLAGSFPDADEVARASMSDALESVPDGSRLLVDGLAMGGLPGPIRAHAHRIRLLSLVHHPLADETGLSPEDRARLFESERAALASCRGVLVTSTYTARRLASYDVPADRVRAVPPGTEAARFAAGPGGGAPPKLLSVGTVTRRKGHDVLVAALHRVRDLSWACTIAGSFEWDPGYARSVVARVAAAGLEERIDFVGELEAAALDAQYHGSSIFVLASHYEGYGMALAEALARGLPIVSTTGGAIPHTVPADAAILVPPGDDVALADALRELLSPGATRLAALAAAAHLYARRLPSWEESASAFAAAIEELTR